MTQKFVASDYDEVVENENGIVARNKINDLYSKFYFFNAEKEFLFKLIAIDNIGIFPFEFEEKYVVNQIANKNFHLDGTRFNEEGTVYSLTNNANFVLLENDDHYILYDLMTKKAIYNTKHAFEQIDLQVAKLNRQINNKYINLFADELQNQFFDDLAGVSLSNKDVLYIKSNLKQVIQSMRNTFKTNNIFIASNNKIAYPESCSSQLESLIDDFNSKLYNWINDDYFGIGYLFDDNNLNIILYQRNLPLAQDINTELKNRDIAQSYNFNDYKTRIIFTLILDTGKISCHNVFNIDNEFLK